MRFTIEAGPTVRWGITAALLIVARWDTKKCDGYLAIPLVGMTAVVGVIALWAGFWLGKL